MDAFLAGSGGFVIKDISGVDLVAAIRTVGSGRALLDRRAAAALFGSVAVRRAAARSVGRADRTGTPRSN